MNNVNELEENLKLEPEIAGLRYTFFREGARNSG
jgi:hypothetical protein